MGLFGSSKSSVTNLTDIRTVGGDNGSIVSGGDMMLTMIDGGAVSVAENVSLSALDKMYRNSTLTAETSRLALADVAEFSASAIDMVGDMAGNYAALFTDQSRRALSAVNENAATAQSNIARAFDNAQNRDFASVEKLGTIAMIVGAVALFIVMKGK